MVGAYHLHCSISEVSDMLSVHLGLPANNWQVVAIRCEINE